MSENVNHTPGPWRAAWQKRGTAADDFDKLPELPVITSDFHATGAITNGPEATIAQYPHADGGTESASNIGATPFRHVISLDEAFANFRVMAAAPELLAACKAWIDWMDSPGDGTDKTFDEERFMLQEMRNAIAKAEGRVPAEVG